MERKKETKGEKRFRRGTRNELGMGYCNILFKLVINPSTGRPTDDSHFKLAYKKKYVNAGANYAAGMWRQLTVFILPCWIFLPGEML